MANNHLSKNNKSEGPAIYLSTYRAGIIVNQVGKVIQANEAACQLLGYSMDEIVSKTIQEINPHLSLYTWNTHFEEAQKKVQSSETEVLNHKNLPLKIRSESIIITRDKPLCVYFMDSLTEANRNKELLDLITSISNIGVWEWDIANQEVLITKELFKLVDSSVNKELFAASEIENILTPILTKNAIRDLKLNLFQLIRNGGRCNFEIDVLLDSEKRSKFYIHAELKVDKILKSPIKIVGTLQDITKVAQRSEDMYFADYTINRAEELIYWIDKEAKLSYFNNTVCTTFGYSRDELRHMSVPDLDPDFPIGKFSELWDVLLEKKYIEFESINKRANGEIFPVFIRLYHTNYNDQDFMVTYAKDISDEVRKDQFIELSNITLNQSSDMILWCKEDGSIYYQNKTLLSAIDESNAGVSKLTVSKLIKNFDFKAIWKEKKRISSKICKLISKNKKEILVEAEVNFITHLDEDLATISLKDITERKNREAQLQHALEEISGLKERLESEKNYLEEEISVEFNFNNIISRSPQYKKVLSQVAQVANSKATVLITGETGTGKELLARAVHNNSDRAQKSLVKVNCASLPPNLIESALFGHEKGSFTGAHERKIGRFELAHKGTIFLDEIGELPLDLQPKLLRVLQEGEIARVGSSTNKIVDVRIIAATNRNLAEMVNAGKFREDLYYRLNVFPIYNLPLRERKDDIPLLVQFFIDKYGKKNNKHKLKVPKSYIDALLRYDFPGNIRELENIVERSIILSKKDSLSVDSLLLQAEINGKVEDNSEKEFLSFDEMQRQYILEALIKTNWKITGENSASTLLGLNGKTLSSKMRKFGIKRSAT